jgi:hypothetical protein
LELITFAATLDDIDREHCDKPRPNKLAKRIQKFRWLAWISGSDVVTRVAIVGHNHTNFLFALQVTLLGTNHGLSVGACKQIFFVFS